MTCNDCPLEPAHEVLVQEWVICYQTWRAAPVQCEALRLRMRLCAVAARQRELEFVRWLTR